MAFGRYRIMDNITTSFEDLEHVYQLAKKRNLDEIRFEFIMSALFPDIYQNIKEEMMHQHALGFAEGQKSKEQD
jgi:hypothetical protein